MTFIIIVVAVLILIVAIDRALILNYVKLDLSTALKQAEDVLSKTPSATGAEISKVFEVLKKHV